MWGQAEPRTFPKKELRALHLPPHLIHRERVSSLPLRRPFQSEIPNESGLFGGWGVTTVFGNCVVCFYRFAHRPGGLGIPQAALINK